MNTYTGLVALYERNFGFFPNIINIFLTEMDIELTFLEICDLNKDYVDRVARKSFKNNEKAISMFNRAPKGRWTLFYKGLFILPNKAYVPAITGPSLHYWSDFLRIKDNRHFENVVIY